MFLISSWWIQDAETPLYTNVHTWVCVCWSLSTPTLFSIFTLFHCLLQKVSQNTNYSLTWLFHQEWIHYIWTFTRYHKPPHTTFFNDKPLAARYHTWRPQEAAQSVFIKGGITGQSPDHREAESGMKKEQSWFLCPGRRFRLHCKTLHRSGQFDKALCRCFGADEVDNRLTFKPAKQKYREEMIAYLWSQRGYTAQLLFVAFRQKEEQRSQDWKHCTRPDILLLHGSWRSSISTRLSLTFNSTLHSLTGDQGLGCVCMFSPWLRGGSPATPYTCAWGIPNRGVNGWLSLYMVTLRALRPPNQGKEVKRWMCPRMGQLFVGGELGH